MSSASNRSFEGFTEIFMTLETIYLYHFPLGSNTYLQTHRYQIGLQS